MKEAGPSMPVEILGLSGVPAAGEPFVVVENESRAREITEFRTRKLRDKAAAGTVAARGTLDQMLARIQAGDAEGSRGPDQGRRAGQRRGDPGHGAETGARGGEGPRAAAGVGQITESDVQLAKASGAVIIAFNVRATSQAREMAQRDGVDIRYFSIIYEVADDIEKLVKGKIAPKAREKFLGYAEVRQVFNITKVGKVAGCMITEGLVKRGAGVRVLRDNVVIHNGELSQLKRFKDDVREVARGYECGLSLRQLPRSAGRRRGRVLRDGDGSGLKQGASWDGTAAEARRRSGSCAWRRKSATCWPACSRGASSAIPSWPRRRSPSPKCGSAPI